MQLYLPKSMTQYSFIWPISESSGPSMAMLYDLACSLKPDLSVCVNNANSDAFATLCQAVKLNHSDGLVYEVQTHTENRANQLKRFIRNNFAAIGYLTELSAEDASLHFSEGSINLIFIDSTTINQHDQVQYWLPKLAENGLLIEKTANQSPPHAEIKNNKSLKFNDYTIKIHSKDHSHPNAILSIEQDQAIDFYKSIGMYWSNLTKTEQDKKNQLIKQIEKKLALKHE